MPSFKHEHGTREFTNGTGADLLSGDLVLLPDGQVGIVEGLAGVRSGKFGMCRTRGTVTCDKATGTAITANARLQYDTTTKLVTIKASGAADAGNILIGHAIAAFGTGILVVDVEINGQGPMI